MRKKIVSRDCTPDKKGSSKPEREFMGETRAALNFGKERGRTGEKHGMAGKRQGGGGQLRKAKRGPVSMPEMTSQEGGRYRKGMKIGAGADRARGRLLAPRGNLIAEASSRKGGSKNSKQEVIDTLR